MSPATLTGRTPLVRCHLVRESTVSYPIGDTIACPQTAAFAARAVLESYDREAFCVAHLNSKHKLISIEVIGVGTLNATIVHPREVFKGAILAGAAAVVLVHNHPSGDPTPSAEDLSLTENLMKAGEILGIRVMDHLVLGDTRSVSIREATSLWCNQPFHR